MWDLSTMKPTWIYGQWVIVCRLYKYPSILTFELAPQAGLLYYLSSEASQHLLYGEILQSLVQMNPNNFL